MIKAFDRKKYQGFLQVLRVYLVSDKINKSNNEYPRLYLFDINITTLKDFKIDLLLFNKDFVNLLNHINFEPEVGYYTTYNKKLLYFKVVLKDSDYIFKYI